ncbi:MAG: PP2C family protein-serine/threonine phosphatase [Armatimonadetes bacterium]|nr:PP2C family protein-serine/threonine phosphatase [Armatimonadota bacterium]
MRLRPGHTTTTPDAGSATDESDVAVALMRTAFIIAFALTPSFRQSPVGLPTVTQLVVALLPPIASIFSIGLFASYLWDFALPLRRPIALTIDMLLVAAAIASFPPSVPQREWIAAVYYLIIMVAAIWFRRTGALVVALLSSILDGVFRLDLLQTAGPGAGPPFLWLVLTEGQTVPMLMVAVAASYIVMARDREFMRAGQLEHDMAMARRLQDRMLPDCIPQVQGLDIGVQFQPARTVGGDLYDLLPLDGNRLLVCVGDMPGKSVYGLVHLSLVHSHMRAAVTRGLSPADIATEVNRDAYDALQPTSYAALFIGMLDCTTHELTFVNCGHLPPLLMHLGVPGRYQELSTGGIVIGATRTPRYTQQVVTIHPGDVLICYTDGITEARNRAREEFGIEGIVRVVDANPHENAHGLAQRIIDATRRFSSDTGRDDRTVLVIRVLEVENG